MVSLKNKISTLILISFAVVSLLAVSLLHFGGAQNSNTNTFIYASTGVGGSITPSGNISVAFGGSQTFTITSSSYQLLSVLVNGTSMGAQNTLTIQDVTGQTTVYATFLVPPSAAPTPSTGGASDYGFIQHPTSSPTSSPALAEAVPTLTSSPMPSAATASPSPQPSSPAPTPSIPEFSALLLLTITVIAVITAIGSLIRKRGKYTSSIRTAA